MSSRSGRYCITQHLAGHTIGWGADDEETPVTITRPGRGHEATTSWMDEPATVAGGAASGRASASGAHAPIDTIEMIPDLEQPQAATDITTQGEGVCVNAAAERLRAVPPHHAHCSRSHAPELMKYIVSCISACSCAQLQGRLPAPHERFSRWASSTHSHGLWATRLPDCLLMRTLRC